MLNATRVIIGHRLGSGIRIVIGKRGIGVEIGVIRPVGRELSESEMDARERERDR